VMEPPIPINGDGQRCTTDPGDHMEPASHAFTWTVPQGVNGGPALAIHASDCRYRLAWKST